MKTTEYCHKNSEVVAYRKKIYSNGFSWEKTYDERGNQLTYKDSSGFNWERTYDKEGNQLTYKDSYEWF